MILVLITVVGMLLVPVAGGSFRGLARLRIREPWIIGAALGVQIVLLGLLRDAPSWVTDTIHIGTYVVAAAFVWRNRALRGLPLASLGGACNFAAIMANGGVMPAWPTALRLAGKVVDPTQFTNSGPLAHARLQFLGDVIPLPYPHSLANVFSIGDVLLVVGVVMVVHHTCDSRWVSDRRATREVAPDQPAGDAPDTSLHVEPNGEPRSCAAAHAARSPRATGAASGAWSPPLPPPPTAPVVLDLAPTERAPSSHRSYPIELLPLDRPADGRDLVSA